VLSPLSNDNLNTVKTPEIDSKIHPKMVFKELCNNSSKDYHNTKIELKD